VDAFPARAEFMVQLAQIVLAPLYVEAQGAL
jgi:hypothetical protein